MYLGAHFVQLMFQWYTESVSFWKKTVKKATLDTNGKRLLRNTDKETWLESNQLKWHSKCRNWPFKLAEKKRLPTAEMEIEMKWIGL